MSRKCCYVPNLRFPSFVKSWIRIKLKDVCFINPKNNYQIPDSFLYIDLESVKHGRLIKEQIISKENAPSRAQRCLENDDILYSCVRPYQHNNLIYRKPERAVASTGFALLRNQISSDFLYCLIDSKKFEVKVMNRCTGTSYPAINAFDLSNIEIFYPDNNEQEKIGNFIHLINQRIETQNKIIEDLLELRKGIIDSFFKATSKSELLSHYLKERKTYSEKGEGYEHVTLSKEGICPKTDRYDRDFLVKSEDKNYKITKLNDICYNPANLKFRVICLNDYGNAIFSPIYVTFEVKNIDPYYLSLYLTSESFIKRILRYQQGTVYERMAVGPEDFCKGKIPIKNNFEIENFIKGIRLLDKKIKLERSVLNDFNIQKTYLLNNLFI